MIAVDRRRCAHCQILTPEPELTRGYCNRCFGEEAEELSPEVIERFMADAVARCLAGGLRAVGRICGHPKCPCVRLGIKSTREVRSHRRAVPIFSDMDEQDLQLYFEPPATATAFVRSGSPQKGAKPENEVNWATTELQSPTEPGCPICWKPLVHPHSHSKTERREFAARPMRVRDAEVDGRLVQVRVYASTIDPENRECELIEHCSETTSVRSDLEENNLIHQVGGRDRRARVGRVLARVPPKHREVLEARYSPSQEISAADDTIGHLAPVAILTDAASRERAESGASESTRLALARLTHDLADPQVSTVRRDVIRAKLVRIRDEAQAMLLRSQKSYAAVAWELGL